MRKRTDSRPGRKTPGTSTSKTVRLPERNTSFPIVGIGSSAGGLEALEQFLKHVPQGSGLAFVVVQHLDPTHKGILVELLQRATAMPVIQVKDRESIEVDHVYVIPPNKDLSILHGVLHLLAPTVARGLRLPIDFFFRSLALDRQDRAIGVILSGMGSDGTLGSRAIKEKAGAVFVQTPESAKFEGMPRSAVDARLADVVAPVEELPGRILAYLKHPPGVSCRETEEDPKTRSALEKVMILLRSHTGSDFSMYKRSTVYRRIERRMGLHQIDKIAFYVRYLQNNPQEMDLLFKELLIGVTNFFRDPAAWEQLRAEAMPALLAERRHGQPLRAWVPGCSTGEEAYSLAMLLKEALDQAPAGASRRIQVFATDLDVDAIAKAREGLYPANIAADVSAERLGRFFRKVDGGYQIVKSIREAVTFAPQNITMDPPFTKLDILSCRNLLIYMTPELQKKLIPLFHYSLNTGGFLFLGAAESAAGFADLLAPLGGKSRIYRRLESAPRVRPVEFPSSFSRALSDRMSAISAELPAETGAVPSIQSLAEGVILRRHAPAAVLVNRKGDILYISGRTGAYLEPAAGKANWNLFAMAREGLRYELSGAFREALNKDDAVTLRNLSVAHDGGTQAVEIVIQPLKEPEGLRGTVLVVFKGAASPGRRTARGETRQESVRRARTTAIERELLQARQETQILREEMETSQEELQSANEELQSTNEELTTSREEMQSLNEELQTVNQELQAKVDGLSRVNNDMKNLLDSTDIATIFLDGDLCLRRYTSQAGKLSRLIASDVGRPITDIASDLLYPELAEDVRQVLATLASVEKQIATRDGRWFAARIMPYRTLDNVIDGVVITFMDITVTKTLEMQLRQKQEGS